MALQYLIWYKDIVILNKKGRYNMGNDSSIDICIAKFY